ncbi:bifunctional UDP-N-acetylglucosamine diphosphorylase/glucosamine-1-phosphate N-acetyltransferase GlmU [Taklimakanibacter lacteus]|uniref:bifunctional UDP-N-acetylglucosamine diphosphorylase/glucosamine-1-phosphate N-acetyltransferase GlmU n=1 Tax=Taklimakanibacter lacteus TaxID=2268456 RepID=UPI000E66C782
MPKREPIAVVVLAAGKGTRMRSDFPKVLHKAAGRTLLAHVLHSAAEAKPERTVVISGPGMPEVGAEARAIAGDAVIAIQEKRQGTAHAVGIAQDGLKGFDGTVLVLYGDVPLIRPETISALAQAVSEESPLAVLGFRAANPTGYGRLIQNRSGKLVAIREELDTTVDERRIDLCNSGFIAIKAKLLWELLPRITNDNAKHEYYLTDLVGLTVAEGRQVALAECPEAEVHGVNTRAQLAQIESLLQARYRQEAMDNGATLIDPPSVFLSADTEIGKDVTIEPHVVIGPHVRIGDNVEILAFSHIEGAAIADGARIGPFARLRPGAEIGKDAHIGNFVEIKKARIGEGAKANHLTYIGDASVGARSNIGAGAITCNYDGFEKHHTEIGADVFVGSNTALVAPVNVGDASNIAAGSVITQDVPADALAIARGQQVVKAGWAKKYRELKKAKKLQRGKR